MGLATLAPDQLYIPHFWEFCTISPYDIFPSFLGLDLLPFAFNFALIHNGHPLHSYSFTPHFSRASSSLHIVLEPSVSVSCVTLTVNLNAEAGL